MLKGAILGFSRTVETVHVPAFLKRAGAFRVEAVADADPARRRRASAQLGNVRTYAGAGALFSKEARLDFVVLDTPVLRRAEHLLLALANDAHVLCERPLCLSVRDWDRVRREAARRDRRVFTACAMNKCPQLLTVRRVLDEKLLGPLSYAAVEILRRPAGREGGVLAGCGWDAAALVLEMLRKKPVSLAAKLGFGREGEGPGLEETADLQLHFPRAAAHIHLSGRHHADRFRATVSGPDGAVELLNDVITLDIKGAQPETIRYRETVPSGPAAPAAMAAVLDDFLRAMADPEAAAADLDRAGACARVLMNAVYSNAVRSAAVPL